MSFIRALIRFNALMMSRSKTYCLLAFLVVGIFILRLIRAIA